MIIVETKKLRLRLPELADADMLLKLFNQADCIKYIGDKNIKTVAQAESYINDRFLSMYQEHGFCLFVAELIDSNTAIGICGLIKRDGLDDVDIGFAILTEFQGRGLVTEAAIASRDYALKTLGLKRLVGITDLENTASGRVLEKIGLRFEQNIKLTDEAKEIKLYAFNV